MGTVNMDTSGRRKPGAKRAKKMNAFTYALLINLLMEGTRTCRELAEETGLHILTIYDYTYHLHKAKALFIVGWDGEGRNQTRIFMLGRGKDVPRPSKSRRQIADDYRSRKAAKELLHKMAGSMEGETICLSR